jgi:hypothetical protein
MTDKALLEQLNGRPGVTAEGLLREGHTEAAIIAALNAGHIEENPNSNAAAWERRHKGHGGTYTSIETLGSLSITAMGFTYMTGLPICRHCRFVPGGDRTHDEWSTQVYGYHCGGDMTVPQGGGR